MTRALDAAAARRAQGVAFVLLAAAPLAWLAGRHPESAWVFASALGLIALGTAHGLHDLALIAPGDRGRRLRWAGVYLLLFLIAAAVWWLAPAIALVGFLALAAVHFGLADRLHTTGTGAIAEAAWRGLLPLVLPALMWPEQVTALFAALGRSPALAVELASILSAAPLLALVGVAIGASLLDTLRNRRALPALELGVVLVWLALAPPLLGFAVYFVAIHSLRHLERLDAAPRRQLRAWLGPLVRPETIGWAALTLILSAALVGWIGARSPALIAAGAWPFLILACLTLPHMLVVHHLARRPTVAAGLA